MALPPPPISSTLEQNDGTVSQSWARWLQQLRDYVGALPTTSTGGTGTSSDGRVNVKDYGALVDGSTDDTLALEAAAAAAGAMSPPGVVYTPTGTAIHTRPIYSKPGVTFEGDGKHSSIWQYKLSGSPRRTSGPNIVVGYDHSTVAGGSDWCTRVAALTTGGTYALKQKQSLDQWFDAMSCFALRLPASNWTWKFVFRLDEQLANGVTKHLQLVAGKLGGGSAGNAAMLPAAGNGTALDLYFTGSGGGTTHTMTVGLRYEGTTTYYSCSFSGIGGFDAGTVYEFELGFSGSAIYVFANGTLWTRGAQVPTAGSVSGAGFVHYPWEFWNLGSGGDGIFPSRDYSIGHIESAIDAWKVSDIVRHTANYTPSGAKETVDSHTLLMCNFDSSFKDCLVFSSGTNGVDYYVRAQPTNNLEMGACGIRKMGFAYGMGPQFEFASGCLVENVAHNGPEDGWLFVANGYESRFVDIDIIGAGRCAWHMAGGASEVKLVKLTIGGRIGMAFNSCNVSADTCLVQMHPGYYVGAMMHGGGTYKFELLQLDNEEPTPTYVACAILEDPQSLKLDSCMMNTPPSAPSGSPLVFVNHRAEPCNIKLDHGLYTLAAADPVVKVVGDLATFATKISFEDMTNSNASPLCNDLTVIRSI
jgi:hypothetical protein